MRIRNKHEFESHIIQQYPHEACGVVVEEIFIPINNISDTPEVSFIVDPLEYISKVGDNKVDCIIHSHTINPSEIYKIDPRTPSSGDMEMQRETNIPWGIVATNGEEVSDILWFPGDKEMPLEGRTFIHGVYDCYAVFKHYFWQKLNIDLPDYPRDFAWWNDGADLYEKNYKNAGFIEVPLSDIKEHDVVFLKIQSDVSNHAAVYLGNDTILHHLPHRLSNTDSLSRWNKYISKVIRSTQI